MTEVVRRVDALRALVAGWKRAGEVVVVVPTMGALHAGHLALVERAKAEGDRVIVAMFVNPTQFNDPADLARYPRTEAADLTRLRPLAIDAVFAPSVEEVYPPGDDTTVSVGNVAAPLEGAFRPGHFKGVATVVVKLLGMTLADVACFGERDWQQLQVVRRMAADLAIPVRIVGCPTVREPDGLALSSRNVHLPPYARARTTALPREMAIAAAAIARGEPAESVLRNAEAALLAAGFDSIDYFVLRDAETLSEPRPGSSLRLLGAATICGVRLIDNMSCSNGPTGLPAPSDD